MRGKTANPERADGARCASLRFSSVSQHLLRSDERQAQLEPVMAPAWPPEADSPVAVGYEAGEEFRSERMAARRF